MKSEDAKEGMLVEVRFSAIIGGFEGDDEVLVKRTDSKSEHHWDHSIPTALCTPILPDFGAGDVVEWDEHGLIVQAIVKKITYDVVLEINCLVCEDAFRREICPPMTKCKIVRKAGEKE